MKRFFYALTTILMMTAGLVHAQQETAMLSSAENTPDTLMSEDSMAEKVQKADSAGTFKKIKVDGVAAVVGDYVILESDIDKQFIDLKTQGVSTANISRCQLLGKLMEDKLYAHMAIQDSVEVADAEVTSYVERQIAFLVNQVGSMEKLLQYYKKDDEKEFREELNEIIKERMLAERMQAKIVEAVEITPEEVRQWYNKLDDEEKPYFGDEVEIAQIVKEPKPTEEEIQKTIDKLNAYRSDIIENGSSFAIKQTLYSEDPGKNQNNGVYSINKNSNFVQEFKDVAFSLKEGEVSKPFKSEFGYHILTVERIRGQERDVRHILLRPEISQESLNEAKAELDSIRTKVIEGEFTFSQAARNFSDQKETRFDGGVLRNPDNMDTRFELTKMDPVLYSQVSNLKGDEISQPLVEETRTGVVYKLIKVNNRYDAHQADYVQDYVKIKELALKEKQFREIAKWMDENIKDTYISVNSDSRDCDFKNNWLKK
ncbi:peptidylprolyl isomerase [Robertkochia aurantiaca]|uniref:peptidylprolyl isomerase n=1 Tax=Robertkochia aurantiaca TaxID=2873700 RepID=UPI001CCE5FC1|nr:peptidylprolyl isomerase [Robertkochia sp. 3YJGBD-33]